MTINQIKNNVTKAKTLNTLKKYGERVGVKLGNTKDLNKAKNKILNAITKERNQIKQDLISYENKLKAKPSYQKAQLRKLNNQRNKLIDDLYDYVQDGLLIIRKGKDNRLKRAEKQFRYLIGEHVGISGNLKTAIDTNAPLKKRDLTNLMGNNFEALINITKREIDLLSNPSTLLTPNIEFNNRFKKYLDEYYNSGYIDKNERNILLNKFTQFSYAQQSYFLNELSDFSRERYRVDETDIDDDSKENYKRYINDMLKLLDNAM